MYTSPLDLDLSLCVKSYIYHAFTYNICNTVMLQVASHVPMFVLHS